MKEKIKAYTFSLLLIVFLMGIFQQCSGANSTLNIAKKIENTTKKNPFVVVVPSYNNRAYFENNLSSIFSQDYDNFRVIYVDDASTDETLELVKNYIETNNLKDKVELVHNETNKRALYNLYKAIHSCKNDEIVVILDGDDWFASTHVLSDLNKYYADKNVWMTYGQYIRYPDENMGLCKPVTRDFLANAKPRQGPWLYSHLRTFYAGLFKRIQLEDLTQNGQFYPVTYDLAIMYPMLEMAREHAYFTPDISYVYNWENPITDQKIREQEQLRVETYIRGLPIYKQLKTHPKEPFSKSSSDVSDLIVFSYNRPMQLYALLESTEKHVKGFRKIGVLYRADEEYDGGYEIVKKRFPQVHYQKQPKVNPKKQFKPMVMQMLFGKFGKGADYVVFAVDDIIVTDDIDITKDIDAMIETGAYGVYYRLGKNINSCYMTGLYNHSKPNWIDLSNDLYSWQFKNEEGDWNYPNSVDFTLFRKKDIKKDFEELSFTYPSDLEGHWSRKAPLHRLGLCHGHTKQINIPMNLVTDFKNVFENSYTAKELNTLFLKGLKIDIAKLHQHPNSSPHVGIKPEFVSRDK